MKKSDSHSDINKTDKCFKIILREYLIVSENN